MFGNITGLDPRSLGANELAAQSLGIPTADVLALQNIAYQTLAAVPEPSTYLMMGSGLAGLAFVARRRQASGTNGRTTSSKRAT